MNPPPNPRLCMLTSPLHIRAARAASTADPFCSKMFLKETPVFYLSFSLVKETDRLIATSRVRVTEFKNSRARARATYLPMTAHGAPSAQTAPRLKVLNLLHDGGCTLSGSGGTRDSSLCEVPETPRAITAITNAAIIVPIITITHDRTRCRDLKNKIVLSADYIIGAR